jgi:hypothetical protein
VLFRSGNADAAEVFLEQSNTSLRVSDHDGFVVFLALDDPLTTAAVPAIESSLHLRGPNPVVAGGMLYLDHRHGPIAYQWFDTAGRLISQGRATDTIAVPAELAPGTYWLRCQDPSGRLQSFQIYCQP